MKRIVECLLEAGILEEDIHRILDMIEEEYEIVDETIKDNIKNHHRYVGGSATFSYKGNDYSYTPERGLKKEGKTSTNENPVADVINKGNQEFDKARNYKYGTKRLVRKMNKKLNKQVAKMEKEEGKGSYPEKKTPEISKSLQTINTMMSNKADSDKNFNEVNKAQKENAKHGKGVKYEDTEVYSTKKNDGYSFRPVVKTSK